VGGEPTAAGRSSGHAGSRGGDDGSGACDDERGEVRSTSALRGRGGEERQHIGERSQTQLGRSQRRCYGSFIYIKLSDMPEQQLHEQQSRAAAEPSLMRPSRAAAPSLVRPSRRSYARERNRVRWIRKGAAVGWIGTEGTRIYQYFFLKRKILIFFQRKILISFIYVM